MQRRRLLRVCAEQKQAHYEVLSYFFLTCLLISESLLSLDRWRSCIVRVAKVMKSIKSGLTSSIHCKNTRITLTHLKGYLSRSFFAVKKTAWKAWVNSRPVLLMLINSVCQVTWCRLLYTLRKFMNNSV